MEYIFKADANPEKTKDGKLWCAFAVPWAPNKKNGGVQLMNETLLEKLEPGIVEEQVKTESVIITDRYKKLKSDPNIMLIQIQDFCQKYLDDFGILHFWIQPGKWYHFSYKHKISSDSHLFVPTILPTVIIHGAEKPTVDFKIWTVNALTGIVPKHVIQETPEQSQKELAPGKSIVAFTVKNDWGWDEDTRFSTENWESSDDE